VHTGVLRERTHEELQLLDSEGLLLRIPLVEIAAEKRTSTSLMPAGQHKALTTERFADLIAYLDSLKQPEGESRSAGMPGEIPSVAKPVGLVPLHQEGMRFDHPVWCRSIRIPTCTGVGCWRSAPMASCISARGMPARRRTPTVTARTCLRRSRSPEPAKTTAGMSTKALRSSRTSTAGRVRRIRRP
jgi:hypothetical protein